MKACEDSKRQTEACRRGHLRILQAPAALSSPVKLSVVPTSKMPGHAPDSTSLFIYLGPEHAYDLQIVFKTFYHDNRTHLDRYAGTRKHPLLHLSPVIPRLSTHVSAPTTDVFRLRTFIRSATSIISPASRRQGER